MTLESAPPPTTAPAATSRSRSTRLRLGLSAVVALALSSGCQTGELAFTKDNRLTFETPQARDRVAAPVTVRWSMRGFQPVGLDGSSERGRGAFVVFVDRAPMPVGKDLNWLARNDSACKQDPRCPDLTYLASQGVYVTAQPSATIPVLPAQAAGVGAEQHQVTVVLVNGRGQRIGESAWYLPLTSRRLAP